MIVTVRQNFEPLSTLPLTTPGRMKQIGEEVITLIKQRTERGLDYQNAPFHPYSDRYREQKGAALLGSTLKSRRMQKQKGGGYAGARVSWFGPVDLTVSGAMLGDIVIVGLTDDSVTIGFSR